MAKKRYTVVDNTIDSQLEFLNRKQIPYVLTTVGHVPGLSMHDFTGKTYPIRRLEHGGLVVIEQMRRYPNVDDLNDMITAYIFIKEAAPVTWEIDLTVNLTVDDDKDFDKE